MVVMPQQPRPDLMGGEVGQGYPPPGLQPFRPRNESQPPLISFD